MNKLLNEIRSCELCKIDLPLPPRPILNFSKKSKILIIGQAPGKSAHENNLPWADASGKRLREWLNVDESTFYNPDNFAIIPMGFCYPGKGKSGDLPPLPICSTTWHSKINNELKNIQLTLLIGQYAQKAYLKDKFKKNLTETVRNFDVYLPEMMVLPHPSPRNRFWLTKNPWFQEMVIPELQHRVSILIE